MDLGFFQENWGWISSNYWGSLGLLFVGITVGATTAKLYYQRPTQSTSPSSQQSGKAFSYPQFGRHGKNALSNSVGDVDVGEPLSLRSDVPQGSRLTVEMRGPAPTHLSDTDASWYMTLGQSVNWTWETYKPDHGGKQRFVAEGGLADLLLHFARPGEIQIAVYEGDSKAASWSKTLHVHRASRPSA